MIAEIKALYPKPGLAFASEPIAAVVPDIFVQPHLGGLAGRAQHATLPRVLINHGYYVELPDRRPTSRPRRT